MLVGDFNTEVPDNILSTFLYQEDLENLVKDKGSLQNANNPTPLIFLKLIIIQLSRTQQQPSVIFQIATN